MLWAVDFTPKRGQPDDAREIRLRRSWWSLIGAFGALAAVTAIRLAIAGANGVDVVLAGLIVVVGVAGVVHRRVIADLERDRRMESESFQRILQGLSRSVSPGAIVDAIVEDLGVAAGADHTGGGRLPAAARVLEATLFSRPAGIPSSTTVLPLRDLGGARPEEHRRNSARDGPWRRGRDCAVTSIVGSLVGCVDPAGARRGRRGVSRTGPRLLVPRGGGAGVHGCVDRPAEPALFRRVL